MKTRTKATMRVLLFGALAFFTMTAAAEAASGVVNGRLRFYQNQGNYCPSSRTCTAARYRQADYNINSRVRDVKVYLVAESGGVIGQGTTNSNGDYQISWYKFLWPWQSLGRARIEWYGEHRDGRFALKTSSGGRWVFWTPWSNITAGTTSSNRQSLGTRTWGNSSSPHALANLYDGAVRMWRDSLNSSNRMRNSFNGIEIRAYDSTTCPTSCASGPNKRIIIDSSGSAYRPQARVMHEMGHIASYLSKARRACVDYTFGGNAGWNMTSSEWGCAGFEEAVATFFGDRAIYWAASPQPTSCNSAGVCGSSTSIETSTGSGSCVTGESRQPRTANRYLRDLYDSVNETNDGNTIGFSRFFDTLARFNNGSSNRAVDEPWNWWGTSLDDRDGRSARDFRAHIEGLTGSSTSSNFTNNCSPVGD
ncbi:MAG: hypothetical protein P8R42_08735 [Candidatus Binatia bacterium]|nr:hypothetical protein [Candidatus Binatia bacterium]